MKVPDGLYWLFIAAFSSLLLTTPTDSFASSKKEVDETVLKEELLASQNVPDTINIMAKKANNKIVINDRKFKSALEYVYSNHPRIKAQRAALKATDEGVAQAISGFRPNITASFSKGRARAESNNQGLNYSDTKTKNITITQPLFTGGKTFASFKASKELVKAARADLSALEQQVLYNAVVAYTDVVEKKSVLKLNRKNVVVLQKQMDVTNARFKVGELTKTDISQAAARLARAEADARQSLGDFEAVRATFRRIIGYDAEDKIAMPSVPSGIPESFAEAKKLAQINNPILEAARYNEKAANSNIYVTGSTLLPTVNLQGIMNTTEGGSISAFNNFDSDSIKINVNIPIYQSGAEWSRLREARNLAQQAKFNSIDTNASVIESVNLSWEAFNTSKAIIVSNKAAVNAAETALNGVRKENEFGVRTILDVLNAEQETFSARVNLARAIRIEKLQAFRLLAAVGKLTSKDLNLKTEVVDPKEHYNNVKYQLLGL